MITRLPCQAYKNGGDSFHFMLMSDLHIGAANTDKALIRRDLELARTHNARIFMNGDLFDLILPSDHKRFNPAVLDPCLRDTDAILNATLNMGCDMLRPYADLIDMIGVGNHEVSTSKHHSVDIVSLLIERLSTPGHKIAHGGYTGAIVQPFRRKAGGGTNFSIWYHHGYGGSAPVSKGLITFHRASTYVSGCDVLWLGHAHNRLCDHAVELRIPPQGGRWKWHDVRHIMTGAYTGNGQAQIDDIGNYRPNWAREKGFAPQGRGGVLLKVVITAGAEMTVEAVV